MVGTNQNVRLIAERAQSASLEVSRLERVIVARTSTEPVKTSTIDGPRADSVRARVASPATITAAIGLSNLFALTLPLRESAKASVRGIAM